jgi:hypothetical protein
MVASEWHVHCAVLGGSKVAASRGIDRVRVGELDGEVIGLEVVGAVSPKLGVHDGHGYAHGHRRGSASGLCSVGSCEVVGRNGVSPLGVGHGVALKRIWGEGSGRGVGLGLLFSLESNWETTRGRDSCPDLLDIQKGKGQCRSPLVGLQGRKERDLEARVVMDEFKFEFEFFKPGLKVYLGSFSEVSNMLKSTWPKFENFRARYARFWRSL